MSEGRSKDVGRSQWLFRGSLILRSVLTSYPSFCTILQYHTACLASVAANTQLGVDMLYRIMSKEPVAQSEACRMMQVGHHHISIRS
jgi:hypothetical protein